MIKYIQGNILDSDCEAIVNTINCRGVAGKGLALAVRKKYPKWFEDYKAACDKGEVKIGKMHLWQAPKYLIIDFPTKDDWRKKSEKGYIATGLAELRQVIIERKIKRIALPALGCRNGGLAWGAVKMMIEGFHTLLPDDVEVVVYEPH